MLTVALIALSVACVFVWRRASDRRPTYQPGTFFALLFLGGLVAPGIPMALVEGGDARTYVVPLVLTVCLLLGVAACVRPGEEEWAEDEEQR